MQCGRCAIHICTFELKGYCLLIDEYYRNMTWTVKLHANIVNILLAHQTDNFIEIHRWISISLCVLLASIGMRHYYRMLSVYFSLINNLPVGIGWLKPIWWISNVKFNGLSLLRGLFRLISTYQTKNKQKVWFESCLCFSLFISLALLARRDLCRFILNFCCNNPNLLANGLNCKNFHKTIVLWFD